MSDKNEEKDKKPAATIGTGDDDGDDKDKKPAAISVVDAKTGKQKPVGESDTKIAAVAPFAAGAAALKGKESNAVVHKNGKPKSSRQTDGEKDGQLQDDTATTMNVYCTKENYHHQD